jgi:hypothetical protein
MTNKDKSAATWSDVKAELGDFDRAGLLGLVQDLFTSSKDNQNSARPFPAGDVLKPYKTIIGRWLRPDLHRHAARPHYPVPRVGMIVDPRHTLSNYPG